ncbi:hypothetical protein [Methanoregula formicica]|uniref:Uncharacterized protein n=1 Tax=Methanoregula formicica (strain DSM 22288 / NBRC 105244 / SMSP) TaxID=593750 RepID=L0HHU1_METFS|nr:hypothetical protein [Methanoregula formicica]AGB03336.1 hypothetical protein Metfor_2332 [Methanoregula formicica SMSP]
MIRLATRTDTEVIAETLGKKEQVKKVFWTLFLAIAGLVLEEIVDPGQRRGSLGSWREFPGMGQVLFLKHLVRKTGG